MFPLLQKLSAFPKAVLQTFCAPKIGAPEKELRFTRSRQAIPFWITCLFFLVAACGIAAASTRWFSPPSGHRIVENGWWALLPLVLAIVCLWAAVHLTRHAYIILTPIGIELFPLFFPSKNLNVVYWPEIEAIHFDDSRSQMIIDIAGGSKTFLTLAPIRKDRLALLVLGAEGRIAEKAGKTKTTDE
ncbi:MAG: hypothetical protein ACI8XO_004148 [Verrucomicrobiales bacterium]|jgi:hypothetical protein